MGLEVVSRQVADLISGDVLARLDQLEQVWGPVAPSGADPSPKVVFWTMQAVEQIPVEDYPMVMVMGRNTPQMRRADAAPEGVSFDVTYALRVLVLVRGDGHIETAALRGRLGLAVRECLLARQSMAGLRLDESSLSESYSDVAYDQANESTVAGVYLDVHYLAREVLAPRRPGTPMVTRPAVRAVPLAPPSARTG